jgi:hypothetical protein
MNELLTLAIVPAGLWLLLVFLRVRGVAFIFSILVGKLLSEELAGNVSGWLGNFSNISDIRQIQLALLLLPVVLTVILTRSKTPKSKILVNAVLLLFGAVSLVLLALPYTDLSGRLGETGQNIVSSYQSYIICAAGIVALVFTWLPDLKKREKHKR